MSVLITADLHIDKHRSFDTIHPDLKRSSRLQDGLASLEWVYMTALDQGCSAVIIAGDLFHTRHKVDVEVYNLVFKALASYSLLEWHIVAGNHDQYTDHVTSIEALGYLPHVSVYVTSERVTIDEMTFDMIPYREVPAHYLEEIGNLGVPDTEIYCVTHVSIDGAVVGSFEHRPKADMYVSYYPDYYKHVYAGHYHTHQTIKNFSYTGSLVHLDRSDVGQDKGVILVDKEGHEFLPYEDYPKFVSVAWSRLLEGKDEDLVTGNFVDLKLDVAPFPSLTEVEKKLKQLKVRSFQTIYQQEEKVADPSSSSPTVIQASRTSPSDAIRNYVVANQKAKRFTSAGMVFLERGKSSEK